MQSHAIDFVDKFLRELRYFAVKTAFMDDYYIGIKDGG
jgi:hypothetical protein